MTIEQTALRPGDPALGRLSTFLGQEYFGVEDPTIDHFGELSDGWETDLYHFRLRGIRDGSPLTLPLVARLYRGDNLIGKAEKEFRLMQGVSAHGIVTPRAHVLVTDQSILGAPFIVMEYIEGGTLETRITPDNVAHWLKSMAVTLAQIHSVPWTELISNPSGPVPRPDQPSAFVSDTLIGMDQTIDQYKLDDFRPTMDWLRERETLGASTTPALTHNDFHAQNILLRGDQLVVIDWSFAEVSDYRLDLAWSVMLAGVMLGFEHRPTLVEAYEAAAGARVEHFEYFEALKFAMRMLTIATWLDESVAIPVPGITRQAIRGDYKVHVMNPYRRLREITGLSIRTIEDL